MACPYLTGLWTFRCTARPNFVIPSITEETRYCLSKHPERCPHYMNVNGRHHNSHVVRKPDRRAKMS